MTARSVLSSTRWITPSDREHLALKLISSVPQTMGCMDVEVDGHQEQEVHAVVGCLPVYSSPIG